MRVSARAALAALALLASAAPGVSAQQTQQTQQNQQAPPPGPPPSPVIARVEGRPITQRDYDQVAQPYFARLRAQLKEGFTEDIQKFANRSVLDELMRREVLAVESQRQKIVVSETETDRILRPDPFFYTNGKFDPGKLVQYKISPGSNYLAVLPKLREIAAAAKLDSIVRARSTPTPATLRAEWAKRNEQVRFKFLPITLRDISLEPEATEEEWAAYYAAHPDQFIRKARVRLRYLRLQLPPQGDSLRPGAEADAMVRGRGIADSLRAGAPIDTLAAPLGGATDTGLFDAPPVVIPGLGRVADLVTALAHADSDTTVRVVGPALANDAVVVGVVAERQPRALPPMREVLGDVKRSADMEKRGTASEAGKLAWYEAHRDTFRVARARLTRVVLNASAVRAKEPRPVELERWYARHGRELSPPSDTAGAGLPALTDSLRAVVSDRMLAEARAAAMARSLEVLAAGWRAGRDVGALARTAGAVVETLVVYRDSLADAVFPATLLDSLFTDPVFAAPGAVRGPRGFDARAVVWRVNALDTTYVRPFESVRGRAEQAFSQERRAKDEAEGRAYYEVHRSGYQTRPKYVIDYVAVNIPPPDSVKVPEADVRKYYNAHLDAYRREEEVHARHILLRANPAEGGGSRAKARADSLRKAILDGADFADLALRFSQDPGSASSGGDLGFFSRGRMVKEFSDTSFALPPGQVSQPVQTQFGYHLIKVDEHRPAGVRPLEEVQVEIRRQLAQARGDSTALRTANAMRRQMARGADPQQVAGASGGITTAGPFAATDPIPRIGLVQGLEQELEKLPLGRWSAKVYRANTAYVLVRPTRRIPPAQAEFEEVKDRATEEAKTAKKKEILAQKVAALRAQLAAGASLDSLAAEYGGLKDSGLLSQASGYVPFLGPEPRIVTKAFAMKRGVLSDTLQAAQGVAWIRVEERTTVQGASFAKDRDAIIQEMLFKKYTEWVEQKKKTMKVEILRADLREEPRLTKTVTISSGGGP
jgi:parvulin-like peptidyl-prolyl isomerase